MGAAAGAAGVSSVTASAAAAAGAASAAAAASTAGSSVFLDFFFLPKRLRPRRFRRFMAFGGTPGILTVVCCKRGVVLRYGIKSRKWWWCCR
ncbi:hypothetical protein BZA05DRAFT_401371 [Tricharina praecox]|uniref:uncharacterized protein n=1 Tax=Tricharina praecox TaxID=43433 RepID=UPI00221E769C|nr:uncharacterized protein BZA05DRAFT_401371 [Tricharina praecox]KAI5849735.1 hypothetical protein BZA05DRAFT_401371 [Tricharina praecox]